MNFCRSCGGEIEFRYINGSLRPLHVSGGCASTHESDSFGHIRVRYDRVESYLTPNARCPICNKFVWFYRSPYNGRVFFDDVGWPWPKHGCFVSESVRDDQISPGPKGFYKFNFSDNHGVVLSAWSVASPIIAHAKGYLLAIKDAVRGLRHVVYVRQSDLSESNLVIADIAAAPAVIIPKSAPLQGKMSFSFICIRLERVARCEFFIRSPEKLSQDIVYGLLHEI